MRPPFGYYGAKVRLADRIVALMPDHRIYVEPYAGSLAVLLAKAPATHEVVNDLDGHVVNFWRQLRDNPGELERLCWATPYSRAEYDRAMNCVLSDVDDDLERARLWWVRVNQSHGRTNTNAGWSTGFARSGSRAHETLRSAGRIPPAAHRLRLATIECRDGVECIEAYDDPEAVHYVDPPYPEQARNSVGYAREMGAVAEHERLAETLHACEGTVLLSGYSCPLYEALYGGWERVEWTGQFRSNGGRKGGGQYSTECLWSNRQLVSQPELGAA